MIIYHRVQEIIPKTLIKNAIKTDDSLPKIYWPSFFDVWQDSNLAVIDFKERGVYCVDKSI